MAAENLISKRYLIVKHIGQGGMADVYVAIDTVLKREVAIKILKADLSENPIALARFRREANASTCLSHPNIVDIYDVGEDNGKYYLVMEYIKGQTLKQLIRKRGMIPYKEAVSIMRQLCSAIMEAHRKGIIHRDIKSQNILIKDDGTAKVVDFGIAIANNALGLTSEDTVLGSVHYMAPEIAKGETASMQSDIYSLGIVFYELLSGKLPFDGENAAKIIYDSFKKPLPSVRRFDRNIPQSLENIIIKATAKNCLNRYNNVAVMLKDLNECLLPKHADDGKIVLENKEELSFKPLKNTPKPVKKKTLHYSTLLYIFMFLAAAVVVALIFILCYFGGLLGSQNRLVAIPDIRNMSTLEAADVLDDYGLKLDLTDIKRELTDDIQEGLIIKVVPEVGAEVEKGARVKVIVSDGIAAIMPDFVGKDLEEVRNYLKEHFDYVNIEAFPVKSKQKGGTIVEQKGILPSAKFDPKAYLTIELSYSEYKNALRLPNLVGKSVEEAEAALKLSGIKYKLIPLDLAGLSEEEVSALVNNTIYKSEPAGDSFIAANAGVTVKLYYVEKYE